MAHYLRDQLIKNVTINRDTLSQLSSVFSSRQYTLNAGLSDSEPDKKALLTYIIRFDNKGYRVFSLEDLLQYFDQAKEVERILFTVETVESRRSNRQIGTYLELRLDQKDSTTCFLSVTSDDRDWVDASFSAVQEVLSKDRNNNGWARSAWTQFGVQIVGVTLIFVLSLWLAARVSPKLAIQNSFIFAFLFVLLIFSNTWTYINQRILWSLNTLFPSIKFYRADKDRFNWLLQAVVGGIVVAIVLYVFSLLFAALSDILGGFANKG
jgi:hypothetical protein